VEQEAPSPDVDPNLGRWKNLHKKVRDETQRLIIDQHIYKEVKEIIVASPTARQGSSFHPWLDRLYVDSQLVGVRRLCDRGTRTSLWGLLEIIKKRNELIHVDRHIAMWTATYGHGEEWVQTGRRDFELFCGAGQKCLPRTSIRKDQAMLLQSTRSLENYATTAIAHMALEQPARIPTFLELERALGCMEKLVVKYGILLNGSESKPLLPTWQYDWTAIFRAPWVEPRKDSQV
jgi:hypothetical protein